MTVDRREAYYARAAALIAADPLTFYVRAERGRRLLLAGFPWPLKRSAKVVAMVRRKVRP